MHWALSTVLGATRGWALAWSIAVLTTALIFFISCMGVLCCRLDVLHIISVNRYSMAFTILLGLAVLPTFPEWDLMSGLDRSTALHCVLRQPNKCIQ